MYSGQAQTINCSTARRGCAARGCYALLVGDPYAGAHNVDQFYNPAAFRDPAPVATIGQTDFSPLGGPRSQVTGPPMRQLDMGFARRFRRRHGEELRISRRDLQSHEHGGIQSAGERVLNFNDARNFASMTTMRNRPRQVQLGAKFYW